MRKGSARSWTELLSTRFFFQRKASGHFNALMFRYFNIGMFGICHIIGNFAATNFGKVQYPILASCRLLEKPDGWKIIIWEIGANNRKQIKNGKKKIKLDEINSQDIFSTFPN